LSAFKFNEKIQKRLRKAKRNRDFRITDPEYPLDKAQEYQIDIIDKMDELSERMQDPNIYTCLLVGFLQFFYSSLHFFVTGGQGEHADVFAVLWRHDETPRGFWHRPSAGCWGEERTSQTRTIT